MSMEHAVTRAAAAPRGAMEGRPTMGTTSRSSHSMRDETILGAGRLEQVHLMVDERLRESQQARMAAGEDGRPFWFNTSLLRSY